MYSLKIPFFIQEFTDEMEEAAIHALRNEPFVGGESVSKFEEEFARYTGTKHAVSVSSGNSALQISLMALGNFRVAQKLLHRQIRLLPQQIAFE